MQIIHNLAQARLAQDTVITIGAFDGIHLGHQAILGQLVKRAKQLGCLSNVVTFQPHPRAVLYPALGTKWLTTLDEKIMLMSQIGLDVVTVIAFTKKMADMSAQDFVAELQGKLHMRELWIGADFALGRGREGNARALSVIGQELGFAVRVVDPVIYDGHMVSSTHIRALIKGGRVREAGGLLNRYYSISGEVVHGAGRGRRLGFPTANVSADPTKLLPADGVYAACVEVGGIPYHTVVNIGVRPSFDNGRRTVEAHLFDFEGDLYGQVLTVEFIERLREERRFDSIEKLVSQIRQDCAIARDVLCRLKKRRDEEPSGATSGLLGDLQTETRLESQEARQIAL